MISKPLALSLFAIALVGMVAVVQWRAAAREASVEAQYPPSGQFVEVDGTKIHLKISGQGPDIVLIHGASGSLRDFTFDLVGRLDDNYRVIAVDRPGLGWSERPPGFGGVFNTAAESPALQAQLLQEALISPGSDWRGDGLLLALKKARQQFRSKDDDRSRNALSPLNP